MNNILVIEDEDVIRKQITKLLERNHYQVTSAASVEEALQLWQPHFDLVLADIRLPGAPGTDILTHAAHVPVIMMTSYASIRSAVESMRKGAVDYISKPFDHEELLLVIGRSLREKRLISQNAAMRRDLERVFPVREVVSRNERMQQLVEQLQTLPAQQQFLHICGERGTGKELLARRVHASSDDNGPLVFADIPALTGQQQASALFGPAMDPDSHKIVQNTTPASAPSVAPGYLQLAQGGTLVLRDPFRLSPELQQQLLELFSDSVDGTPGYTQSTRLIALSSRLLAATPDDHQDTDAHPLSKLFGQHQYAVPALRERREDLVELAAHYLSIFVTRYRQRRIQFSEAAKHAMLAHDWPGNVSELKTAVKRAVLMVDAEEIQPLHLGFSLELPEGAASRQASMHLSLDGYFRYFVLQHQSELSETELASKLGISRKALWERRQKMQLPRNNT